MRRLAPTPLLLCALAACHAPTDKDAGEIADAANAIEANAAANIVEPQRSILRPEVIDKPDVPAIEPVDAVIGFGQAPMALDDAARSALDRLLATPAMKAGGPVTLRGHSDSRGSDGDNRVASRIRGELVRDYLVEKGVARGRISLVALGETRPIAPNGREDGSDDPEGRAKNRRVEVHVALPAVIVPPPVEPKPAEKP
ncbi:OmpA family protein [Sphingobium sp. V4]|uniref:OmpA family protein n=1 Tax=Sphingobium sp. V4 TaxID=3038927 RepID=UPI00255832B0|nr:OmpA family protein [Sphingobium sp. V4]WIW87872.1 OmpA family protein [Sphingobium sp. V4]